MSTKFIITWDNMQTYTRQLAEKLLPADQWTGIIAVSRGGLVPAAILARELGIRHVDTVCISSYDHDHQRDMRVIKKAEGDGEGFIIVRELYPRGKFVTVCAKPAGQNLVDDYVVDIPQETWIEQPWDMAVTFVDPIAKK